MNHSHLARKITAILFLAQSLGSAGFIAIATVGPIVGAGLGGSPAWSGVPSALYLLGAAFAALFWGYAMDRFGRRGGLVGGMAVSMVGAIIAGASLLSQSLVGFLTGMVFIGAGRAAVDLGRFAAAEVHPVEQRGRAISNVVLGGTVGSILGPFLLGPASGWSKSAGQDELAGAFIALFALLAVASVVVAVGLRPDPRDLGREIARAAAGPSRMLDTVRPRAVILREFPVLVAMTAMLLGQAVMVMLMVITSLHMKDHQHGLSDISVVISSHTFGMYAFSIVSGRLADRWGRAPVILIGAATLFMAALSAPLSPDVLPLSFALFLLGLGWNFCYVGGSSLLSDKLSALERSRMQGLNDLLVGLASALGSVGSGLVFAAVGYSAMAYVSAAIALVPMGLTAWWWLKRSAQPVPVASVRES